MTRDVRQRRFVQNASDFVPPSEPGNRVESPFISKSRPRTGRQAATACARWRGRRTQGNRIKTARPSRGLPGSIPVPGVVSGVPAGKSKKPSSAGRRAPHASRACSPAKESRVRVLRGFNPNPAIGILDRINKVYRIGLQKFRSGQKCPPPLCVNAFVKILSILLILSKNCFRVQWEWFKCVRPAGERRTSFPLSLARVHGLDAEVIDAADLSAICGEGDVAGFHVLGQGVCSDFLLSIHQSDF